MSQATSEAPNLHFERVAQAARLVAPVSNGSIRNRRVAPPPPPPPLVVPARSPSNPDAVALRAWEKAAVEFEADWATPLSDDEEAVEHTAPLETAAPSEPSAAAPNANAAAAPVAEVSETSKPDETATEAVVESAPEKDEEVSEQTFPSTPEALDERDSVPEETELEALARAVSKSALDALATRAPAGRRLPAPPAPPRPPSLLSAFGTPPAVSRTPLPPPVATRSALPPLSPPQSSRPLPALAPPVSSLPPPARPPQTPALRTQPVPPPAPRSSAGPIAAPPRRRLETLPSIAKLASTTMSGAPSLLEMRHSPLARRFYAQLGVAAVVGALLATVLFAVVVGRSATATPAISQAAAEPAAANTALTAPATKPEPATVSDSIPPPPITSLSIDDLEREPARAPAPPPAPGAAKAETAALAGATKGTLHITAVPAANVAIDGRPLGITPKIVRLSPGTHRVALIGPSGRRSQIVNVAAGQTAAVSVKF